MILILGGGLADVFVVAGVGLGLLFFCLGLFAPDRRRNLHFALSGGWPSARSD